MRCRSRLRRCAAWQRSARGRRLRPSRASLPISVVQGPGLHDAVHTAVLLECRLPPAVSLPLLRHNDARVRAAACRVARPHADVMPLLVDLLDDLHEHRRGCGGLRIGSRWKDRGATEARPPAPRRADRRGHRCCLAGGGRRLHCAAWAYRTDQPRVVGRRNRCSGCNGQSASTGHRCDSPQHGLGPTAMQERDPRIVQLVEMGRG